VGLQGGGAGGERARRDERWLHALGVRQDWSIELGRFALMKLAPTSATTGGLRLLAKSSGSKSCRTVRSFRRQIPAALALDPVSDRLAIYLSQRVRPIAALTLEAGVRYERASLTGDAIASPRLNASWQPTRSTTVAGRGVTTTNRNRCSSCRSRMGFQFGPAGRARQAVVGVDQSLGGGMSARIEGYTRDLTHLRPMYVNTSSSIRLFPETEDDRILVEATRGRSRGVEFSLEREGGKRIDWSASYVLSSSEQQVGGLWIPRISDQPRALHVDWSLHPIGNAWGCRHRDLAFRLAVRPNVVRIDTIGTAEAMFKPPGQPAAELERVPKCQRRRPLDPFYRHALRSRQYSWMQFAEHLKPARSLHECGINR
jgi:outer membrane receptor protein involved in Fe transport